MLAPLTDVDLGGLRYYGIAEGHVAGIPAWVARTGYTGEDGFEVFVETARTGDLWDALLERVQALDGGPVGLGARDTLRLEAGMPLYGNELDLTTNPYDAGLGRVVKLDKAGDFIGRAALEKVAARWSAAPPGRPHGRGPRHRSSRLPGPCRRPTQWRRHQRDAVADAGRPDRDGLRRADGRRTGHRGRRSRSATRGSRRGSSPCRSIGGPSDVSVPTDLRYTRDHEWVRVDGDEATVGITQYAADQLGDIVFVELPEAGRQLDEAKAFGVVESVKAVSDLFAPVSGEVTIGERCPGGDARAREQRPVRRGLDDQGRPSRT